MQKRCFLCNSYQKFYSALLSLDDFVSTKDFFVMVSAIDKFLSEFRNITFVLEKSISHTDNNDLYKKKYVELRDKFLSSDETKWLKDKRNEVLKESPFEFKKVVYVDVYLYGKSQTIINEVFTFDNWEDNEKIEDTIKKKLKKYNFPEIYFSAKIKFLESNKEVNIIDYIKKGINSMVSLLNQFSLELKEECCTCRNIKNRILDLIKYITSRELLLERDYEYISQTNSIKERGRMQIIGVKEGNINVLSDIKMPYEGNVLFGNSATFNDRFKDFISMHVLLYSEQNKHIMPTFFIFYDDGKFRIDSFLSESKSTVYRKINSIASTIDKENIISIFVVWESYLMDLKNVNLNETYEKRVESSEKTLLCFYYIDKSLEEKSTTIDSSLFNENNDLKQIINNAIFNISQDKKWQIFYPFKYEFAKKYHKYLNLEKL